MDWKKRISRASFLKILFSIGLGVFFGSLVQDLLEGEEKTKQDSGYGNMPYGGK